jgi:hypothetical protein
MQRIMPAGNSARRTMRASPVLSVNSGYAEFALPKAKIR